MKPVCVEINDKMQKGYVYWRTKPMGREFRLGFNPDRGGVRLRKANGFGPTRLTLASWNTLSSTAPQSNPPTSRPHF